MRGAIPPLTNTHSWRGPQLRKALGQLYLLPLPFQNEKRYTAEDKTGKKGKV
jgi:hypothetical protein